MNAKLRNLLAFAIETHVAVSVPTISFAPKDVVFSSFDKPLAEGGTLFGPPHVGTEPSLMA